MLFDFQNTLDDVYHHWSVLTIQGGILDRYIMGGFMGRMTMEVRSRPDDVSALIESIRVY